MEYYIVTGVGGVIALGLIAYMLKSKKANFLLVITLVAYIVILLYIGINNIINFPKLVSGQSRQILEQKANTIMKSQSIKTNQQLLNQFNQPMSAEDIDIYNIIAFNLRLNQIPIKSTDPSSPSTTNPSSPSPTDPSSPTNPSI